MKAQQLLLQNGEETIEAYDLSTKMTVLVLTYSNRKLTSLLEEKGVPCISDESPYQSGINAQTKKTLFSLRAGGGERTVKTIPMKDASTFIEGTGRQTQKPDGFTINGLELFDAVAQLATNSGNVVRIRTRRRPTETNLSLGEEDFSDTTKIYFIPKDKVEEKMKKGGNKACSFSEAREILKGLMDATWTFHGYNNPTSVSLNLVMRQPENKSPDLKPSPFSFS